MIPINDSNLSPLRAALTGEYPRYIEDYRIDRPDWANQMNAAGDGNDWRPALLRLQLEAYTERADGAPDANFQIPVLFGARGRSAYTFSAHVPVSGLSLIAAVPGAVALLFPNGTDGFRVHFPTDVAAQIHGSAEGQETVADLGPLHPLMLGRCAGASFHGLFIQGTGGEGTRGIAAYNVVKVSGCDIRGFASYGIDIDATALRARTPAEAIENGGSGNANHSLIEQTWLVGNGGNPGADVSKATTNNPLGLRPIGAGIRIQGADGNIVQVNHCRCISNNGFGIHDTGFLGNRFFNNEDVVNQWTADADRLAVPADEPGFWRPEGVVAGDTVNLGSYWSGDSSQTLILGHYTESPSTYYLGPKTLSVCPIGGTAFLAGGRIITGDLNVGTHQSAQDTLRSRRYRQTLPIDGDSGSEELYFGRLALEDLPGAPVAAALDGSPLQWGMRRYDDDDPASQVVHQQSYPGCWVLNYNDLSDVVFAITTAAANSLGHASRGSGLPVQPGRMQLPAFYLERTYQGVSTPTQIATLNGTQYEAGSWLKNTDFSTPGSPIAWVWDGAQFLEVFGTPPTLPTSFSPYVGSIAAAGLAAYDTTGLTPGDRLWNEVPSPGAPSEWVWDGAQWLEGPGLSVDQP